MISTCIFIYISYSLLVSRPSLQSESLDLWSKTCQAMSVSYIINLGGRELIWEPQWQWASRRNYKIGCECDDILSKILHLKMKIRSMNLSEECQGHPVFTHACNLNIVYSLFVSRENMSCRNMGQTIWHDSSMNMITVRKRNYFTPLQITTRRTFCNSCIVQPRQ